VLHPNLRLRRISDVLLDSSKSFSVRLQTDKGEDLTSHCELFIESQVKGWKRMILIRSKKTVLDYSGSKLVTTRLPFDHANTFTLEHGIHKGTKVSLLNEVVNSKGMIYQGFQGQLVIRKKFLIFNYTLVPLTVCESIVFPG